MRTTLEIADEVLAAAKELARRQGKTAGQVISELARQALTQGQAAPGISATSEPEAFAGFRPFAPRGAVVTNEIIDRLREAEGI